MFFLKFLTLVLAFESPPTPCQGPLTRQAVVVCARAASPRIRADNERVAAARGDAEAARVILPSNPAAAVSLSQRTNRGGAVSLNVTGTISQRIEIGGQRRKRVEVSKAQLDARRGGVGVTEREVVAAALLAYYDVLAARREVEVIERGYAIASRLQEVAAARATAGLGAPLETDLAAAKSAALRERFALARGQVRIAEAILASSLGLDPAAALPEIRGDLDPLPGSTDLAAAVRTAGTRPEIEQASAQRRAGRARVGLLKRSRAPTLSFSFFVQKDGFDERVIGAGLSLPIPMPAPLGRTNKREIQAARARVREAEERIAVTKRQLGLEVAMAFHGYEARREASLAYTQQAQQQAQLALEDVATEIERGRLPVRDALLTQQALLDLLLRGVESKHELCRASVALAFAAGRPLDGGAR